MRAASLFSFPMPVWPKSFYTLRASMLTARTAGRLRGPARGGADQSRTFAALTRQLAGTSYWQQAGVEVGMDYPTFRRRVVPRTYEQLAPELARTQAGEAGVLWPGRCAFFAATAGTEGGAARTIPITEAMLAHFRRATRDALLYYTARVGHAGVYRGRHLLLGGTTALTPLPGRNPADAFTGNLGGIAALNLPVWAEKHLYEPGATIGEMADWDEKVMATTVRCSTRDISLLAGMPQAVLSILASLRAKNTDGTKALTNLQQLWPNLECYLHSGIPVGPFYDELRAALGPTVNFHECYVATEGFIAAQDGEPAAGLRVIADAGLFFEFIPATDFDESRLESSGRHAVPLAEVKPGVDYVVLLTTPGGLARYVLGDIVRFVSNAPPRLIYVGRTRLRLSAFGESVQEKEVTDILRALAQRSDWTIVNFHVAPKFSTDVAGGNRGRHEWWIELRPGTTITPTGPAMAAQLDADLQRSNPDYAARRKAGTLDAPFVRLVMPGVFEHWLRFHRRWGGHHKLPRCRSDRLVADELAQMTNFARD